jgi:hypothetical protein
MMGVKARLATTLIALASLLVMTASVRAQSSTPERAKAVDKVYKDYRDDGVIKACDHSKKTLQKMLDELPPEADVDTPDLRPALEAGIEQHSSGDCKRQATPAPTPTPTPTPTATPAPTPAATPDDNLGAVPPPSNGGKGGGGGKAPLGAGDVTPLAPDVTPVPPAATPAPAAPPAAEPSGPAATPEPVYRNADDGVPLSLLLLAGLLALVALVALLYALVSRLGWGDSRLAATRRAWREARFRAGGTWGDFADWIRVGR